MPGLLDDMRAAQTAQSRGLLSHVPQQRVSGRQVADAMQAVGLLASPIPVVGDVAGLLGDAAMYAAKPEERTWGNAAMTLLGALPMVPSVAGQVGKKVGKVAGAMIDEATGLPLNPDGTVTLYHATNRANADSIVRGKFLRSAGEPSVYFSTQPHGTGYGDTVVEVKVPPSRLRLDDEFPGGRRDFAADLKSARHTFPLLDARLFEPPK